MTFSDRIAIEQGLYDNESFKDISIRIGKDASTISKEVKRVVSAKDFINDPVDCINVDTCKLTQLCHKDSNCDVFCKYCSNYDCTTYCKRYSPKHCDKLLKPPYVCNGCSNRISCHLGKKYYRAKDAQKIYDKKLKSSREGINKTLDEIKFLNELVSPLIMQRQPISHIYATHADEIGVCRQTLYNYIDAGLFDAKNIDLPRRVRYKKRKKLSQPATHDYKYRSHRTYRDFENYILNNPDANIIELDTVKGTNDSGKCLLTMLFRSSYFMLIFLLPRCTMNEVVKVFDRITELIGLKLFNETFPVFLTDNGPEFKDPFRMECTEDGEIRTKVFYCDPQKSNQKSRLEKNHEYIRYILPKGKSMYKLTDESVLLITNHINSVARDSLNGHTPFDMADMLIDKKVLESLNLHKVSPDSVQLTPALIKK